MRVNELVKELGKTSKEVLEILQKQNQDVKSHSSNINEDQIQMVKQVVKSGTSGEAKAPAGVKAGIDAKGSMNNSRAGVEAKPQTALGANTENKTSATGTQAGAPKKKIAAVYRPQNSQQRPARPKTQQSDRNTAPGKVSGTVAVAKSQTSQSQGTAGSAGRSQSQRRSYS